MECSTQSRPAYLLAYGLAVLAALSLAFAAFMGALWRVWLSEPEFSYGVLIPFFVAYLLWDRRAQFRHKRSSGQSSGMALVVAGSSLQVLGSLSGTLIISGIALVITLIGIVDCLWGAGCVRVVWLPLSLLILMVPVPSYAV